MRIILFCLLVIGASVSAENREKRQASYTFPGPRSEAANRQAAAAVYQGQQQQQQQQQHRGGRGYSHEDQDAAPFQPPPQPSRRQYQPETPVHYVPVQQARPSPQPSHSHPQEPPVYEPAPRHQAPAPRQSYAPPAPSAPRKKASSSNRANKYGGSAPQQSLHAEEEEEEQGPDPLTLLLEDSKFTCGGKTDGYYADDSVNCQVFHYCISGARHSWMCPEATVFHQVHLNCVPDSQDICSQSQKFHFVNDYLYKPVDYQGPNNTARYAQRYYPDGYVVGDPLVAPHDNQAAARPQSQPAYRPAQVQSYPASAPAPISRPAQRHVAPAAPPPAPREHAPREHVPREHVPREHVPREQSYPPQSQSAEYGHNRALAAARGVRPSRPAYQGEVPPGYRPVARHEIQPRPIPAEDEVYQPQPEARRPVASNRGVAGYSPPRQPVPPQYRPTSARSSGSRAQYPQYATNQAAGVQYDEDY